MEFCEGLDGLFMLMQVQVAAKPEGQGIFIFETVVSPLEAATR